MRVKGIKRGKIIEIFEDIDIPDGEEITIAIETKGSFWESWQRFRQETISMPREYGSNQKFLRELEIPRQSRFRQ